MNGLILFIGVMFMLWLGRAIFVPVLMAAFVWYLINAIAAYYRKIMPRYKKEKQTTASVFFDILAGILGVATFGGFIALFITQIQPMLGEFTSALPGIQGKLTTLGHYVSDYFGISFDAKNLPDLSTTVTNIGMSAFSATASIGMILVYLFFMFIEQSTFNKKFAALFPGKSESKKMSFIFHSIDENMKKYMFMKTFIAGVSAIASYFWLIYLGLPFAGVWAFIVFITSYVPTIGAIVSSSLPILFSLIFADNFTMPILVAIGLIVIQIVFGNILEPKLTGKTLNLSTLAILINLVFWGLIWGVAGMFFSVPLLVATFITTAQFDSTRWIAVLLSADGEIPDKKEEQ